MRWPDRPAVPPRPVNAPRMINFTGVPEGMQGNPYYGTGLSGIDQARDELANSASGFPVSAIKEPFGGAAHMVDALSRNIQGQQALSADKATRQQLAAIMGGIDINAGPTNEQIGQAAATDIDFATKLYADARAARSKESYGPVISGDAAAKLGLDPKGQYQLNLATGQYEHVSSGAASTTVNVGSDKLSDWLAKDTIFYPGARNANLELTRKNLDNALASGTDAVAYALDPTGFTVSEDYKRAFTAARSWLMNVLRKESGAVIGDQELRDGFTTYFPKMGDGPDQIAFKRQLRDQRTNSMRYGLENGAPNTLAQIDADYEALKKSYEDQDAKEATPAPDDTGGGGGGVDLPYPGDIPEWWPPNERYPGPGDWKDATPEQRRQMQDRINELQRQAKPPRVVAPQ